MQTSRSIVADSVLVGVGGAVGVLLRAGLSELLGPVSGWPWHTFTANILGAFLLGLLIARLPLVIGDVDRRRSVQLTLGTGLLGGFTTYSALALESISLMSENFGLGSAYIVTSLLVGVGAAWVGLRAGGHSRREAS